RGLPGAVTSHQGMNLAGAHFEVDRVERDDAWEALGHSAEHQARCRIDHAKDHSSLGSSLPPGVRPAEDDKRSAVGLLELLRRELGGQDSAGGKVWVTLHGLALVERVLEDRDVDDLRLVVLDPLEPGDGLAHPETDDPGTRRQGPGLEGRLL